MKKHKADQSTNIIFDNLLHGHLLWGWCKQHNGHQSCLQSGQELHAECTGLELTQGSSGSHQDWDVQGTCIYRGTTELVRTEQDKRWVKKEKAGEKIKEVEQYDTKHKLLGRLSVSIPIINLGIGVSGWVILEPHQLEVKHRGKTQENHTLFGWLNSKHRQKWCSHSSVCSRASHWLPPTLPAVHARQRHTCSLRLASPLQHTLWMTHKLSCVYVCEEVVMELCRPCVATKIDRPSFIPFTLSWMSKKDSTLWL